MISLGAFQMGSFAHSSAELQIGDERQVSALTLNCGHYVYSMARSTRVNFSLSWKRE